MSDTVILRFPRETRFHAVARLVVGGMAAPLQMSFDALDDLQLAISSLLDHDGLAMTGELELRLEVDTENLRASLGRFDEVRVRAALDGSASPDGLGLRRLLDTIVDDVEVGDVEPGEHGAWVTLTKRVEAPTA